MLVRFDPLKAYHYVEYLIEILLVPALQDLAVFQYKCRVCLMIGNREFIFSDQTHSDTHWTKIHKKSKCAVCDNIKMFTNKTDHLVK